LLQEEAKDSEAEKEQLHYLRKERGGLRTSVLKKTESLRHHLGPEEMISVELARFPQLEMQSRFPSCTWVVLLTVMYNDKHNVSRNVHHNYEQNIRHNVRHNVWHKVCKNI
jgi:hypothetical protein